MSLDTYDNLKAEIAGWLRRSDLTATVPTFISLFEAQMNRALRARQMLTRTTLVVSSEYTTLPTDFLEVSSLRNADTNAVLRSVSAQTMDEARETYDRNSALPERYNIEGSSLRLSPVPSASSNLSLLYWAAIPVLSASNTTNWLLTRHPDAYLYGSLTQSAPYLRNDERLATWSALFGRAVDDINGEGRRMGGALEPQPSTFAAGAI
jgi:hypothetical protein